MGDLERGAFTERVRRVLGPDVYQQPASTEAEPERQPREVFGQPRGEAERTVVVAHPAESGDGGDPRPGQRRDVQTVARVVFEVVQVQQRGLPEVVVGQLQVADLRRDDCLSACGQRGVADR